MSHCTPPEMSGITASPASTGKEIMSAVARDSPELRVRQQTHPAARHCRETDWVRDILELWLCKYGGGWSWAPRLVLPLRSACVKWKQHWHSASSWLTGWLLELKLMYERKNPLILSFFNAGRWNSSHLLPHPLNPSIHPFILSTEICKEATVMMKTHKMLHYGWACAADAVACLCKRTCWKKVRMQVCGCYIALATLSTHRSFSDLQRVLCRPHLMQYAIHSRALPPPNTYIRKVDAFLLRAPILRKSIPIILTLFFPMHQNVDRVKRRWWHAGNLQYKK